MARSKLRRRSRAIGWLTLCCFTLFSLLPGYLLPSARAGAPNLIVICTQDGWVEVDLGADVPPGEEQSHECGDCILCFCSSPAGPNHAIVDDGFHDQLGNSLSPSAATATRGRTMFWLPGAPRAPPAIPLS